MLRFYGPRRRRCGGRESRNYYVRIYDPATGRRTWKSTGCPTLRTARAALESMRLDAALGGLLGAAEIGAADALGLFEAELRGRVSAHTLRAWVAVRRRWVSLWGSRRLREIRREDLVEALLRRKAAGASPRTLEAERKWARSFFKWCLEAGYLQVSPAAGLRPYRVPERAPRVLSGAEQDALLGVLSGFPEGVRLAVIVALETGLRKASVLALRWEWLDLERGWIEIPAEHMKGGRDFRAPLSERALAALRASRRSVRGPVCDVSYSMLGRYWRRLAARAGLPGVRFHSLRKTFLTNCRRRGVSWEVSMALSDHRDFRTVLRSYRAVGDQELLDALGREEAEG